MKNKIIVEFDREELRNRCKKYCVIADRCKDSDYDLINCIIVEEVKFKIKEQNNGKNNKRNV